MNLNAEFWPIDCHCIFDTCFGRDFWIFIFRSVSSDFLSFFAGFIKSPMKILSVIRLLFIPEASCCTSIHACIFFHNQIWSSILSEFRKHFFFLSNIFSNSFPESDYYLVLFFMLKLDFPLKIHLISNVRGLYFYFLQMLYFSYFSCRLDRIWTTNRTKNDGDNRFRDIAEEIFRILQVFLAFIVLFSTMYHFYFLLLSCVMPILNFRWTAFSNYEMCIYVSIISFILSFSAALYARSNVENFKRKTNFNHFQNLN